MFLWLIIFLKINFIQEILEDVHESISSSGAIVTPTTPMASSGKEGDSPKKSRGCANPTPKRCVSPTSVVTMTAPSRVQQRRRGLSGDDSSSTKTEIEEMDQFSDLEDYAADQTGEEKKAAKVIVKSFL